MIYASDFRKGITFEMNGEPHVVLDFQHVKPGKGAAFVRTKYRNILTGATREEAFNPNDKFPKAHIETKQMQYLYNDGELYYFMDQETYDQVPLTYELEIGKDCEMVRMTPDWLGVYDIICYFAEKLALNDTAVNTSLINSKVAYVLGAKTKAAAEALKNIFDKINAGEACAVYDTRIQDDPVSKTEPFTQLKLFSQADFITDKLLETHQTIIDEFDAEIGIKTVPYKKAERMVQSEADSKSEDSMARINLWIRTLNDSFKNVNRKYGLNLHAFIDGKEDVRDGENNTVRS